MLNQAKNYVSSIRSVKSLIEIYVSKNVNPYSNNYFVKFLSRNYKKDNFVKLSTGNKIQENHNASESYSTVTCKSLLCHNKRLSTIFGISKSFENLVQREYSIYQSFSSLRYYSTENNEKTPEVKQKMLMDYPLIVWPSLFNTIRVWFMVYLIIKPYYEMDFSIQEFCKASKQAFVKVSNILSQGDFSTLSTYIDANALEEIKKNFSVLSVKERLDLAVNVDDIFFFFPYQIGLIFKNDGQSSDRVFLEVTMCFHIFRGFTDYVEKSQNPDIRSFYEKDDRVSIANYRFIREITKGSNDEWNINIVNYFKPLKLAARF